MRIGRKAVAADLLAEVVELVLSKAAFEKGARIDTRRRVSLDVDEIAAVLVVGGAEEMVEAHVVQGGGGGEAGDVATQFRALPVGVHHHGQGVPADERADAALEGWIAGRRDLA